MKQIKRKVALTETKLPVMFLKNGWVTQVSVDPEPGKATTLGVEVTPWKVALMVVEAAFAKGITISTNGS